MTGDIKSTSAIESWLAAHGFGRYTDLFVDNEIDLEALRELTDEHLKELGLPLGPRVKLRKAIDELESDALPETPASPTEAERRQLTVMFVDMVGSTRLSARLDPEDMRQLLLDYQSSVANAIESFGGHIARYFGDGVLCYFGWPQAHENAAEEAVRAGLAAAAAVAALPSAANESLAARVGIATGLVIVGDMIGEGASEEEAVVGETPNLAARLQSIAEPGQIVLSETTRRLVDGIFATAARVAVELKGFDSPVDAFVVTGELTQAISVEDGSRQYSSELVGREHELAMIEERWQRARAGEGQAVLLTGEAGVGKSRIVAAFNDTLKDEPHYRVRHRWTPFHVDTPLYGSIQHVISAAGLLPDDNDETKLDKLEKTFMNRRRVPYIAELLGIDSSGRYGKLELSSEQLRYETLHALADEIVDISRRRPVCMILEDSHWVDATSLELAHLIMDKIRNKRCLMLMPARPEVLALFGDHSALTRISLNRLSTQEVHRMIRSIAGGKALPQALVDDITAKTDGIPLFVEEVTKAVLASDHVTVTDDSIELNVPVDSLAVPATLQDSLMARLDRNPSAKEVAQVAACLGREFDVESLCAITDTDAAALESALEQLCDVDVVARRGVAPNLRYRFRHALLGDAAYQSLLKTKRREIHARIVALLESRAASEPEVVAQHAYQAGLPDKAIDCMRQAASRDFAQSAYTEAAAHTGRGLAWVRELPTTESRQITEAKLEVMHAWALIPHEGYGSPRTTQAFERASELALRAGDVSISVPVLTGKVLVRMTSGDHKRLVTDADELERICNDDGHDEIRFYGAMMQGYTKVLTGHIETGRRLIGEAKRLYVDDHERRGLRSGYPIWDSLSWWEQMAAWLAGDSSYDGLIAESMELAVSGEHDIDRPAFARCWCPLFYTLIAFAQGDLELARRLATRALALATTHGMPSYQAWSTYVIAIDDMAHGDVELALEQFAQARQQAGGCGFGWALPTFHIELAKAALGRGRLPQARALCRNAAEALATTRELWWEPEVLRAEGDVCLADGMPDAAELAYKKAIVVAKQHGSGAWEQRAQASLEALR